MPQLTAFSASLLVPNDCSAGRQFRRECAGELCELRVCDVGPFRKLDSCALRRLAPKGSDAEDLSHTETVRLYRQETSTFPPLAGGGCRSASASCQVGAARSATEMPQDRTFMQGDVIGLVAFDLVLWIILARVMDVALVVHVARMYPHDTTADSAGLRVPTYVITDFEGFRHKLMLLSNHSGSRAIATGSP